MAVESRNTDKCAFSEARPAESLSDSSRVLSSSTDQLSEMCKSCRSIGSRVPSKQSTSLHDSFVVILTLVVAIVIKILELIEGVVTRVVFTCCLDKSSSRLSVSSTQSDIPSKGFNERTKEENSPVLKVADEEKVKPAFVVVQVNNDDVLDGEGVDADEVKFNSVVLKSDNVDPASPVFSELHATQPSDKLFSPSSTSTSVDSCRTKVVKDGDLPLKASSEVKLKDVCSGQAVLSGMEASTVDGVCFPFVARNSTSLVTIGGFQFHALVVAEFFSPRSAGSNKSRGLYLSM